MPKGIALTVLLISLLASGRAVLALDTVTAALTSKAFQYVPLVIAQERGYMKEEGLELKLVFMQNAAGLQALIANAALVAISKGNAPLKTVLAFNDQVLQWIVARPNIKSLRDLSGKSRHHRRRIDRGIHV
jgi:ABC-type nitrate/sulfonate/bicarbonate transport system substrate-binding protein